MAGNTGGPWGGCGNSGGNNGGSNGGGNRGDNGNNGGGRKPGNDGPQIPEIDELVKKGQEQLRVLMGGRGGTGGGNGADNGGGGGPALTRGTVGLGLLAAAVLWGMTSFYTVRPEQQSIELFLGEFSVRLVVTSNTSALTSGQGAKFSPSVPMPENSPRNNSIDCCSGRTV